MGAGTGYKRIFTLLVCLVVRVLLRIPSLSELRSTICTQVPAAVGATSVPELYL